MKIDRVWGILEQVAFKGRSSALFYLFNLYMSELNEVIHHHKLISYVDDYYVIIYPENLSDLKTSITSMLTSHFDMLKSMGMKCNMAKTEMIVFDQEPI